MSKNRQGFTIIEVVIFLAITSVIFMAIVLGTSNVMSRQRYNESTQNFAEFLRGAYSKLTSIENHGDGRSEKAIYGKLITFGERYNLAGEENIYNEVFMYDIIGDVSGAISGDDILSVLKKLNINVLKNEGGTIKYAGIAESYSPRWAVRIERTDDHELYKGAIIVVRSASTGLINTYVLKGEPDDHTRTIEVNQAVKANSTEPVFTNALDKFSNTTNADFCLYSDDGNIYNGYRRDIRVNANARNSSGVEVMPLDDLSANACKKL
ncbi:prepilin-type N-terminal cleavage/methylation domain-containing protein [Candidatus Saccharibacteria bacterium]|nr:prepilin-type N-terminal cleavage/methylation domain-containing protein [Candidatus Saccharibacteria bacterium]